MLRRPPRSTLFPYPTLSRSPFLLRVDDLAPQRKHRLRVAVAALLGRAAGGVPLHDEELGQRRVAHRAVGELAGQVGVLECGLAREVARLAGGLAGTGGLDRLVDDGLCLRGVLLEELAEPAIDGGLHEALDRRVAELRLGLALELRVLQLDRDDRREALPNVLTLEVLLLLLQEALLARVDVQRPGEGRPEA